MRPTTYTIVCTGPMNSDTVYEFKGNDRWATYTGCPMYFAVRELKIALAKMSSGELFYLGRAKNCSRRN